MILRNVTDDDHEFLLALHNDPDVLKNLTHPEQITIAQHLAWWEKIKTNPTQRRLIFEVNGERVGFAKFYDIDPTNKSCVLGGDIHKDHRGKGFAKHMWSLMLDQCFYEPLFLHRVSLTTAAYNEIGHRVYRGLGFEEEGRLVESLWRGDKFHDQICMYMLDTHWKYRSSTAIGGRA